MFRSSARKSSLFSWARSSRDVLADDERNESEWARAFCSSLDADELLDAVLRSDSVRSDSSD